MKAAVIIATKDRKDDLRRALISTLRQTEPVEIIVLDDGSTDGTSEMVAEEFPSVLLKKSEKALGCIAQRNLGAQLCSADVIFSIDDDAEFSSPDVINQTLLAFCHPQIGAVAIPYLEPHKSRSEFQRAPTPESIWITDSFRGTAHALRRSVFLQIGGYYEPLVHQGEEMDLCIRLLNAGFVVRLGSSDPIIHHEFSKRDWRRMDFFGRRNDIIFAWRNVPTIYLLGHLLG